MFSKLQKLKTLNLKMFTILKFQIVFHIIIEENWKKNCIEISSTPKKIIYQPYLRTQIGNSVSNSNINMFFTVIITVIGKILITQKKKK